MSVELQSMHLLFEGQDPIPVSLTGGEPLPLVEGREFRIRIGFQVAGEIAHGLRYHHTVSRKGINVDKQSYMVGSYGPGQHAYDSPTDELPKGMMARGLYEVKSKLIDDDKTVHRQWAWSMQIGRADG